MHTTQSGYKYHTEMHTTQSGYKYHTEMHTTQSGCKYHTEKYFTGIDEKKQTADHRHMLGMFRFLTKKSSPDSGKASVLLTATKELSKR